MSVAIRSWLRGFREAKNYASSIGLQSRCQCQFYHKPVVQEGDVVLLSRKSDRDSRPFLTKPLKSVGKVETARGFIETANIIGKGIRDVVVTNSNVEYRIGQPTMAEHITLSPRLVTPLYPDTANLIVSLLDLHPPARSEDFDGELLEILEAGTGHGSLTLHLARAIHSFNPAPPTIPSLKTPIPSTLKSAGRQETLNDKHEKLSSVSDQILGKSDPTTEELNATADQGAANDVPNIESVNQAYEAYVPSRRAVIQTLDISPKYSEQAERTIRRFRRGLYWHNVNFNTGGVAEYLTSRLASQSRPESAPFLAHAILDLPDPHTYLEMVSQALQPDGALIIFCPNITQITKCVGLISEKKMPFLLERVLEAGAGVDVGGREWDVKAVMPRGLARAKAQAEAVSDEGGCDRAVESTDSADQGWEMRCRPTVGRYITVGGFIGLWRRMKRERQ